MLGLDQSTHSTGLMEGIPGTRKWGGCQGSWGWKVLQEERRDSGTAAAGGQGFIPVGFSILEIRVDRAFLVTQQGRKSSGMLKRR